MCVHSSSRVERRNRVCTRDRRYPKITNVVVIPIRLATKSHRPTKADCPLGPRPSADLLSPHGRARADMEQNRKRPLLAAGIVMNASFRQLYDVCLPFPCHTHVHAHSLDQFMFAHGRLPVLHVVRRALALCVSNVSPSTRSRTTAAAGYFGRRDDSRVASPAALFLSLSSSGRHC